MMGEQKSEPQLFNYAVNLEKRVRANHPLRQVKAVIDFSFAREEVAHCYGRNGNESVPPEVILKMMFLLFFDDIKSERELMEVIGERLDYLWFLDYGLDEKVPDHSVLSKARVRWGRDVFESLFVRKGSGESRPRYHHHRVVDDAGGVITAVETTPGSIAENKKLMTLIDQHEKNTRCSVQTGVADHKYGTNENYVACQAREITTHMGEATRNTANTGRKEGIFGDEAFTYDPVQNIYRCPAGQILKPRRVHPVRRTLEYKAPARVCAACALRAQCTRSHHGRTVQRHENQEALNVARAQAQSFAARRNRKRRQHLMEASFADAANNHHFKRARWRRLWRQQIQDYLIAAIQNMRILLAHQNPNRTAAAALIAPETSTFRILQSLHRCIEMPTRWRDNTIPFASLLLI